MNVNIAKRLMMLGSPIIYKNIEYEKIYSLNFIKTDKGVVSCAELLDKNKNSIVTVFLKDIETEINLRNEDVNTEEEHFQELMKELRRSAIPAVNSLGFGDYKQALGFIRTVLRVLPDLEEIAEQRALEKLEKEDNKESEEEKEE
nr:MAG TPA: hypothetical protein [Caudoviricetes sp.]